LNWLQVGINALVTSILIGIVGWAVRRWIINVDENIREMLKSVHQFEIKLAEMPGTYVMKGDCIQEEKNNSSKRENLWKELRIVKDGHSERLTKIEAKMEGRNA